MEQGRRDHLGDRGKSTCIFSAQDALDVLEVQKESSARVCVCVCGWGCVCGRRVSASACVLGEGGGLSRGEKGG